MSVLQQLRDVLGQSLDTVLQGWRDLYDRASGALTKFIPVKRQEEVPGTTVAGGLRAARWGLMAAEVFDDDDCVEVRFEAPGMEADEFDIQVRDGALLIRGEKKFQRQENRGHYHLMECAYGRFERNIPLPCEVNDRKAKAQYRRGTLSISLPKIARQQRRRIRIVSA